MAWVCVDEDNKEYIFHSEPKRIHSLGIWHQSVEQEITLPKGSIFKLIGKTLTWEDEPVMLE